LFIGKEIREAVKSNQNCCSVEKIRSFVAPSGEQVIKLKPPHLLLYVVYLYVLKS